ncbi:MAG: hypothetical protein E7C44_04440 [Paeniclostridium sordellii]|nr:hypothetical protein [Paeniclostridium sordellii]
MKIKVFKSHVGETFDTNSLESNVNFFIKNKTVIDIKQSISYDEKNNKCFMVMTVIYE